MKWKGALYIDTTLPFGLRSAPKIFNAVLLWIMGTQGVSKGIHYWDDFLLFGKPGLGECADALHTALETCRTLRIPVAPNKEEGPSTVLTFLGICFDTIKLLRLQACIRSWEGKRVCIKRDLLSLLGLLHHAAKVVMTQK